MANRYAVASGNYSDPVIWDNEAVPLSGDNVYANGFTIVVDQNVTANTLGNTTAPVRVPNIATPVMTSDISPSGIAFSNGNFTLRDAYLAFLQDNNVNTFWQSNVTNAGILGYQYPIDKIIKRYVIKGGSSANEAPRTWTFQGSNDGVSYTTLDTVTNLSLGANGVYTSAILSNSTSYLYYRVNITATGTLGNRATISEFEMTESIGTVFGNNNGGIFNHTSGGFTISIFALNIGAAGIVTYNHLSGTNSLNVATSIISSILSAGSIIITSGNVNISTPQISGNNVSGVLIKNGSGILNFTGNVINPLIANTNYVFQLNTGIVNITGNVNGSTSASGQSYAILSQGAILTVTGNITGGGGSGATHGIILTSGNLIVIGNIIGGTSTTATQGVSSTTVGNITVTGAISAGVGNIGLLSNTIAANVQVSGPLVNVNGIAALYAPKYFITSPSTTITTQSSVGVNNVFYNNTSILDALAASNVRNGISFGLGGSLTGTLKVPLPSQVLVGVETDGTVGTWALVPEDFWNYLTSNTFVSGSMGDRMKNVSTVASTGAQIASYSV